MAEAAASALSTVIRLAEERDMAAVAKLYSHYVRTATCTFEIDPPDAAEMAARFSKAKALGAPYFVADFGGAVAGYAYASTYRDRPAYRHTLESSVYVAPDFHGQGLGRSLMKRVIEVATGGNFIRMLAVIGDSSNMASMKLHASLGFEHVGVLKDVGFKHGRWLDTVLMQRTLC